MKSSRILTYAILGIIGGLLFENKFLRVKQDVKDKRYAIKDKQRELQDETRQVKKKVQKMMHRG